MANELLKISRE
jgi:uncharacterized phage infection (PIP) family protein YhgE